MWSRAEEGLDYQRKDDRKSLQNDSSWHCCRIVVCVPPLHSGKKADGGSTPSRSNYKDLSVAEDLDLTRHVDGLAKWRCREPGVRD